ncbi:MAG: M67 family metallopeptidase [Alphaproteobacteria bacterium]|nr:M67 family metallopeptidase [Alphaproteobacteria bacterium]
MTLFLSEADSRQLDKAARRAYPEECCGLIVGHSEQGEWVVDRIVESTNLALHPERAFEVDTRLRLRLQKELREWEHGAGLSRAAKPRVIGHYHSHPDAPARPSRVDRAQAWEDNMVWLIIGVEKTGAPDKQAWLFRDSDTGFEKLPIEIG